MFKVLVVDDDEELVSAVSELLERNGYEPVTAFSGIEAIEKYSSYPDINVALVDLVMPMMDGFTLIDKLKEINKNIDVIIITGQGTVPTAVEAIKRGAKDFIIKPYDKEVLLNKLELLRNTFELQSEVYKLKDILSEKLGFDSIITRSQTMKKVFEKASQLEAAGHEVVHFEIGRPDFDTPSHIKKRQ